MSMKSLYAAALVALFAAALPAPASAQLGFIKKQLKQKIVHTVVDSALNRVAGPEGDSAAAGGSGAVAAAQPADTAPATSGGVGGFLKKRLGQKILHTSADTARSDAAPTATPSKANAPATHGARAASGGPHAAAQGPQFDDLVVEITPRQLDRLEKFLAAQKARRDGPEPTGAPSINTLLGSDPQATVQFSLMTQRVMGFCAANDPQLNATAMGMFGTPGEMQKNFTPAEVATLRPRCPHLLALLKSDS